MTDDYFDAVAVSDGIAVRMSDNVAEVLTDMMHRLLRTTHVIDHAEVDDVGIWISHAQTALAATVNPRLFEL